MINVANQVGEDKPRWPKDNTRQPKGNTPETVTVPGLYLTATAWGTIDRPRSFADAACAACTLTAAWLIGLPRRAGRRLFAMNDAEAGWRGWQVTETLGGPGRRYRDTRFDVLKTDPTVRSDQLDGPADQARTARRADGWDDVHSWPWDGDR
jgi:hypothetical protein